MKVNCNRNILILILITFSLLPISASAKGLFIFNSGDELFPVDNLPKELVEYYPNNSQLGYHCKHFGIFWADIWTWGCDLSVVSKNNDSYGDLPKEAVSALKEQYPMNMAQRGIWNHYGVLILIALLSIYACWPNKKSKLSAKE